MPAAASIQILAIWPACLALIWLPGVALARLLRLPKPGDWLLRSALEIGLGLSIWPLVLLWSTVIARQVAAPLWSPLSARLTIGALAFTGLVALLYAAWRRPRSIRT